MCNFIGKRKNSHVSPCENASCIMTQKTREKIGGEHAFAATEAS
jgi:hypothetical protein